jgi:phage-related protein
MATTRVIQIRLDHQSVAVNVFLVIHVEIRMERGHPVYPRSEIMARKPVEWLGDSRAAVRGFSPDARRRIGQELDLVQKGEAPADWKAMPSVGLGVNEIRVRVDGAYRVIYVAKFAEAVYVLHAFQKKSRKTARLDVELARQRYRTLIRDRKQWGRS